MQVFTVDWRWAHLKGHQHPQRKVMINANKFIIIGIEAVSGRVIWVMWLG
jgi:hypothetical protein